jgi:peptidoglycan/LPS O-acetylase OafA/YrhL
MINNLQVLRAFAAFNIVLSHAVWMAGSYGWNGVIFHLISEWAVNGVDVFFVISGFIMFYIQHENPRSPYEFLKNRIRRIVPLYWSVILLMVAMVLLMPAMFRQATFDATHTLTSLLFISHAAGFQHPVLVPGWTLEFEMLFYMLFAASMYLRAIPTLLSVLVLLGIAYFVFDVSAIVFEFPMGMLAGYLYVNARFKRAGYLFIAIGALGLLSSLFYTTEVTRVLVWGVPAFFLVLGSCYVPQIGKGVWVMLGGASYAIYLIHTMTLPFYFKVVKLIGITPQGWGVDVAVLGCLVFSAIGGVALYRFYERPMDKLIAGRYSWPLMFKFGVRIK